MLDKWGVGLILLVLRVSATSMEIWLENSGVETGLYGRSIGSFIAT
jgi:hypothetical protein